MKTWTIFYKVKLNRFDKFTGKFSSNTVHTILVKASTKRDAERKFTASNAHTVKGLTPDGKKITRKIRTHVVIVKTFVDPTPKSVRVVKSVKPLWMR